MMAPSKLYISAESEKDESSILESGRLPAHIGLVLGDYLYSYHISG